MPKVTRLVRHLLACFIIEVPILTNSLQLEFTFQQVSKAELVVQIQQYCESLGFKVSIQEVHSGDKFFLKTIHIAASQLSHIVQIAESTSRPVNESKVSCYLVIYHIFEIAIFNSHRPFMVSIQPRRKESEVFPFYCQS